MTVTETPTRRRHTFADLYHERTHFQFIPHSRRWAIISLVLMVVSVGALLIRELNLGIDFEGGTAWQVVFEGDGSPSVAEARDAVGEAGLDSAKVTIAGGDTIRVQAEVLQDPLREVQDAIAEEIGVAPASVEIGTTDDGGVTFTATATDGAPEQEALEQALAELGYDDAEVDVDSDTQAVTVTLPEEPESLVAGVQQALAEFAGTEVADVSISRVGPTWGEEVTRKALQALLIFFLLLAIYLTLRFEWKMAASAIVAVIHDIVFTVGFYALFQFEVTPATVTAFLTILGFSLYDTVVVFDKVRENQGSLLAVGRETYGEMVNRSLNEVLMRSLSTTLVAVLPVISLLVVGSLVMGATVLEDFALALLVGLFIGSYSSIFVAAPLLAWWKGREPQYATLAARLRRSSATGEPGPAAVRAVPADAVRVEDVQDVEDAIATRPAPAGADTGVTPRARQPRRRKRR